MESSKITVKTTKFHGRGLGELIYLLVITALMLITYNYLA